MKETKKGGVFRKRRLLILRSRPAYAAVTVDARTEAVGLYEPTSGAYPQIAHPRPGGAWHYRSRWFFQSLFFAFTVAADSGSAFPTAGKISLSLPSRSLTRLRLFSIIYPSSALLKK